LPGFAIAFDTPETGETVSMSLKALFVADAYVLNAGEAKTVPPPPVAAQVVTPDGR